uniref:Uncharacterized protein n=1 Tax=Caenorhabditis tropicalis TaxID=1561998 RepID=A0A1I7UU80_9PELO
MLRRLQFRFWDAHPVVCSLPRVFWVLFPIYGWIPSTDQLVIIGFLIILITEQVIHGIGHSIGNGHSHSGHSPLATSDSIKMNKFHDNPIQVQLNDYSL